MRDAPPLLFCTRYGKGIKDERWFRHREHLMGPLPVASMLAQTDGNFVWVIHIDADMPAAAREYLDTVVKPLGERVVLNTTDRYHGSTLVTLGKEMGLERDGMLLTGRIDDDDAWHVDTVKIVRERAAAWIARDDRPEAYVMTFALGLEWVMYDVYDLDGSVKAKKTITRPAALRHFRPVEFQGDSVFVVAPSASGVTCLATGHGQMQKLFRDAGYDVDWLLPETPMWLYTRHKQVSTNILHTNEPPLDFTLAGLARDYGIDEQGVAAYLAAADDFDHLLEKRSEHRRTKALQALKAIDNAIDNGDATPDMEERRVELLRELDDLENNLVGPIPL